jgi:nucleoside-diphosphate-sugar epimerase
VPLEDRSAMPILYVDDAVRALLELADAAGPLPRRVYNIAGISPSATEIADAVRRRVPGARIDFAPDPTSQAVVDSWPAALDDGPAQAEWGWKLGLDLEALVERFGEAIRDGA